MFISKLYLIIFFEVFFILGVSAFFLVRYYIKYKTQYQETILEKDKYYQKYRSLLIQNNKLKRSYNTIQKRLMESDNVEKSITLKEEIKSLKEELESLKNENLSTDDKEELLDALQDISELHLKLLAELNSPQ